MACVRCSEPTRWPFTSVPSQAAGDASVCDNVSCGTISNVPSNTCPANTVITNDVFCPGTQMSEDTSLDEVCCELDSFPVAAIIAIVIGVLVLVCLAACVYVPWRGCGCVEAPVAIPFPLLAPTCVDSWVCASYPGRYLFMQRQKVKQARYASERKRQAAAAVATPPPAAAPAPAPAGIEMTACVAVAVVVVAVAVVVVLWLWLWLWWLWLWLWWLWLWVAVEARGV